MVVDVGGGWKAARREREYFQVRPSLMPWCCCWVVVVVGGGGSVVVVCGGGGGGGGNLDSA